MSWTTSLIPDPPPPPDAVVLNETNSTWSPANAPCANTTVDPFVAVNSVGANLTPLTYTSKNPALYVNEKLVWSSVAVAIPAVLAVGNDAHVTPLPTDFKYWPFDPDNPRLVTLSAPVNARSPRTFNLSEAVVVPIPTLPRVWIPDEFSTNLPPVPPPPPPEIVAVVILLILPFASTVITGVTVALP